MKYGHLKRRDLRGRTFAWLRLVHRGESWRAPAIEYRLFRRDSTGASYMEARVFPLAELERAQDARKLVASVLRGMRAQLAWAIDQVEFQRLGLQDPTPRPAVPA